MAQSKDQSSFLEGESNSFKMLYQRNMSATQIETTIKLMVKHGEKGESLIL